jgi:hypothetical protein
MLPAVYAGSKYHELGNKIRQAKDILPINKEDRAR